MWNNKELKEKAIYNMHRGYWKMLGIILILSFLVGGFRQIYVEPVLPQVQNIVVDTTKKVYEPLGGRIQGRATEDILSYFLDGDSRDQIYNVAEKHYKPTEGVFANIYNKVIGARSVAVGLTNAFNEAVLKNKAGRGVVILVASMILIFVYIFLYLPLIVGKSRFILEMRKYDDTRVGKLRFPWIYMRGKNIAKIMVKRQIYISLWSLTVVGGFVKYFEYLQIPFILAENPDIDEKQAFQLSKDMMMGQKLKALKLRLSFIHWHVLSFFTFGLLDVTFTNMYIELAYGEMYVALRSEAKKSSIENAHLLFDEALFENHHLSSYPLEQYPLKPREVRQLIKLDYKKDYSLTSIVLIFFTFSIIGWLWEMSIYIYEQGIFVNRGAMHGPWLPIYGSGGILVVLLLKRISHRPGLTLICSMALCGALEYFTAWYLWKKYHAIWWDYSGYFLNVHGRISAEALAIFGIGAMAFIYVLAPFFDSLYSKIPKKIATTIAVCLVVIFTADALYSFYNPNMGRGITEYKSLEERQHERMLKEKDR